MKPLKTLCIILITAFITIVLTLTIEYANGRLVLKYDERTLSSQISDDATEGKLKEIKKEINSSYIGNVDESKMKDMAIVGYVAGLGDDYSMYYPKENMEDEEKDSSGEYVGIGIYVTVDKEKNTVKIYDVMDNSPAKEAGLLADDIIEKIDGKEYDANSYNDLLNAIKGKIGTKVKVLVKRGNEEKEFEVERRNINVPSLSYKKLDDNIGYIRITEFTGKTYEDFKNAYNDLQNQGMQKLVLDLRNNGGGMLEQALNIGDMFSSKDQTLLITKTKNEEKEIKSKTDREINIKVSVLVNKSSASASEVLTGIIKENDSENAKIVGEKTFGKGVIQTEYKLSDGSGFKLTTAEYFTPSHKEINKIGIEPDENVKLEQEKIPEVSEISKDNDTQLKKAVEILN